MNFRPLSRIAVIGVLCLALSTAAAADQLQKAVDTIFIVGIVGTAALVTVVVLLVRNAGQKRTITGCVNAAPNGLLVTNEKDKRIYALSGDTTGAKPNERMTLRVKKIKTKGSNPPGWETVKITKDLGTCQP
ncbi:MAG: hypothetical protein WA765_18310 [Candidatus Acidiferrum sp.]